MLWCWLGEGAGEAGAVDVPALGSGGAVVGVAETMDGDVEGGLWAAIAVGVVESSGKVG